MKYIFLSLITLFFSNTYILSLTASAEVVARAHGRCKLKVGDSVLYNSYCTVKQKQNGRIMSFVIDFDDGSHYKFYGSSKDNLHVEAYDGIHNVNYKETEDKGVFNWYTSQKNHLVVKLDTQHHPEADIDDKDTGKAIGVALGAIAAGALIAALTKGDGNQTQEDSAIRAGQGKFDATGKIPCAEYKGQPMGQCNFGVARDGAGSASVSITLPSGKKRFISFDHGRAVGADLSQADGNMSFSASKNYDLYIINAGNERYEIPEAVIYGG